MSDWNAQIVEEFRANNGQVGGPFAGRPLLILHTTGAKSGQKRHHPLMYQPVDGGWAIFASKAGADSHPAWYHNLVANPDASVEVGSETISVTARIVTGDERDTIWTAQKNTYPQFAEYEASTDRIIPVIMLQRS